MPGDINQCWPSKTHSFLTEEDNERKQLRRFFETLAEQHGFDPLSLDGWSTITHQDIRTAKVSLLLSPLLSFFQQSTDEEKYTSDGKEVGIE